MSQARLTTTESHATVHPEVSGLVHLSLCRLTLVRWLEREATYSVGQFRSSTGAHYTVRVTRDGCFMQR